jgi:hypothetical protein
VCVAQLGAEDKEFLDIMSLHKLLHSTQFHNDPLSYSLLSFCLDGPEGMDRMVSGIHE